MSAFSVQVESLIFGAASQVIPLKTVSFNLESDTISVRTLIEKTVVEQIQTILSANASEAESLRQALSAQYLTPDEIQRQSETGQIRLQPAHGTVPPQSLDPEKEIARAIRGFQQKAFKVVIDGEVMESLDDTVVIDSTTKIIFLRLTPLVGG